jgi:hypothetical protein
VSEEDALRIAVEMKARGCKVLRFKHQPLGGETIYTIIADIQGEVVNVEDEEAWERIKINLDMYDKFELEAKTSIPT